MGRVTVAGHPVERDVLPVYTNVSRSGRYIDR